MFLFQNFFAIFKKMFVFHIFVRKFCKMFPFQKKSHISNFVCNIFKNVCVFKKIHEIEQCFRLKFVHKFQILFANLKNVRELRKMFLFSNIVLKFENVQFKETPIQNFLGVGIL